MKSTCSLKKNNDFPRICDRGSQYLCRLAFKTKPRRVTVFGKGRNQTTLRIYLLWKKSSASFHDAHFHVVTFDTELLLIYRSSLILLGSKNVFFLTRYRWIVQRRRNGRRQKCEIMLSLKGKGINTCPLVGDYVIYFLYKQCFRVKLVWKIKIVVLFDC